MSSANRIQRKIRPTHPGEMLREDFMPDYGLTVSGLAGTIGVSRQTINELLRERRSLTTLNGIASKQVIWKLSGILA